MMKINLLFITFLIGLALAFAIPSSDGSESRVSPRGFEVGIKGSTSKELASNEGISVDEKSRLTAHYQSIYPNQDNIQVIYFDSEDNKISKSDHLMMQQPDHVIIVNEPEEFEKRQQQQQEQMKQFFQQRKMLKQQFQPQEQFEQPQETYQQSKKEVQHPQQFQKAQEQIEFPGQIIEKEIHQTKPEQS